MVIRLRTFVVGVVAAGLVVGGFASAASAASGSDAKQLAAAGLFQAGDFPAGWTQKPFGGLSEAQIAKAGRSIPVCATYLAVRKLSNAQPHAKSRDFKDNTREVSNEVDVFTSASAASRALTLYAKPSVPTCLERLLKKVLTAQFAKDPNTKGKVKSVEVTIRPQTGKALGDQSVVYEGHATITGNDGSNQQVGLGNAGVRVGRAVDAFSYSTTGAALPEVLGPAIDASLARLQSALGGSSNTR